MASLERQTIATNHTPEKIWGALNTPLQGKFGEVLQPVAEAHYTGLSDQEEIQLGTLITYELDADAIVAALSKQYPMIGMFKRKIPKDVALRVKEHNPQEMIRVDVLESDKHAATIRQRVEDTGNGTGLLVVEGELSLSGSAGAAQDMLMPIIQGGIQEQAQHMLDHLLV
jgi:hypothetical protein